MDKIEEIGIVGVGDKVSIFDRVLEDSWNLVCSVLSPYQQWWATTWQLGRQPSSHKEIHQPAKKSDNQPARQPESPPATRKSTSKPASQPER